MGQVVEKFLAEAKAHQIRTIPHEVRELLPENLPAGWSVDDWFALEERAGILEFDMGLSRQEAERLAKFSLGMSNN